MFQNTNLKIEHLPWLDGLRGTAALWVLLSHVQILSGLKSIPLLSWGDLAVDLFMMLSGFLMAHHYYLRQHIEPWTATATFYTFWVRRFFRIAPLYYVLLAVALLLGHWLGDYRTAISSVWPATATPIVRYQDQSILNILAHVTFTFGFMPTFAFRTPLPDWSIGLEMQFYLLFPFLMFAIHRIGAIKASLIVILFCVIARFVFKDFYHQFQMPAFLPIKLYVFLIVIWIAVSRNQDSMRNGLVIALILALMWVVFERSQVAIARFFLVLIMFYLMNNGTLPATELLLKFLSIVRAALSGKLSRFLGDTSYSTYLLHLIIVLPVAGELARSSDYIALPPLARFFLCLMIAMPIVYITSWGLFQLIEKNGIKLGKYFLQRNVT